MIGVCVCVVGFGSIFLSSVLHELKKILLKLKFYRSYSLPVTGKPCFSEAVCVVYLLYSCITSSYLTVLSITCRNPLAEMIVN